MTRAISDGAFSSPADASGKARLAARLLDVIENDIAPQTERGVGRGDKVFGAAVLRRADGALVVADTNREHSDGCPLWHGEMAALRSFFALPARPDSGDCLLLSTHEPCPMCAAAIAWSGIPQAFFLFDYDDTERQFSIPHDIQILRALFAPATALCRDNRYFEAIPILSIADDAGRIVRIREKYDDLSAVYQAGKDGVSIPLK